MARTKLILHIGSGKLHREQTGFITIGEHHVYLDRSYSKGVCSSLSDIESALMEAILEGDENQSRHFVGMDLFEFMDNCKIRFDHIEAYRIFEHMEYCSGEIGRLLEACNMLSEDDATLDIVVPNAIILSEKLLDYEKNSSKYDHITSLNQKMIINTENHNFKSDAHASTWTPKLAKEYILSEGTWKIDKIISPFLWENRDIYMRILCHKGIK